MGSEMCIRDSATAVRFIVAKYVNRVFRRSKTSISEFSRKALVASEGFSVVRTYAYAYRVRVHCSVCLARNRHSCHVEEKISTVFFSTAYIAFCARRGQHVSLPQYCLVHLQATHTNAPVPEGESSSVKLKARNKCSLLHRGSHHINQRRVGLCQIIRRLLDVALVCCLPSADGNICVPFGCNCCCTMHSTAVYTVG